MELASEAATIVVSFLPNEALAVALAAAAAAGGTVSLSVVIAAGFFSQLSSFLPSRMELASEAAAAATLAPGAMRVGSLTSKDVLVSAAGFLVLAAAAVPPPASSTSMPSLTAAEALVVLVGSSRGVKRPSSRGVSRPASMAALISFSLAAACFL